MKSVYVYEATMYKIIWKITQPLLGLRQSEKLVRCVCRNYVSASQNDSLQPDACKESTVGDILSVNDVKRPKVSVLQSVVNQFQTDPQMDTKAKVKYIIQKLDEILIMNSTSQAFLRKDDAHKILYSDEGQHLFNCINKYIRFIPINKFTLLLRVCKLLRVPEDTVIVQHILQLIRCSLNEMTLSEQLSISTLIEKSYNSSPLGEAVCQGLQHLLTFRFEKEIAQSNIYNLIEMLKEIASTPVQSDLSDIIINVIDENLKKLNLDQIVEINTALCVNRNITLQHAMLLNRVLKILHQKYDSLSKRQIISVITAFATYLCDRRVRQWDNKLLDVLSNQLLSSDCKRFELQIMMWQFSKIHYVSEPLLDVLNQYFVGASSSNSLAYLNPKGDFSFLRLCVRYLSMANVKLDSWNNCSNLILNIPVPDIPLAYLLFDAINLITLDCYHKELLKRVFSSNYEDPGCLRLLLFLYRTVKSLYPNSEIWPPDHLINMAMSTEKINTYFSTSKNSSKGNANDIWQYALQGLQTKNIRQPIDLVFLTSETYDLMPIYSIIATDKPIAFLEDLEVSSGCKILLGLVNTDLDYHCNRETLTGPQYLRKRCLETQTKYPVLNFKLSELNRLSVNQFPDYIRQTLNKNSEQSSIN